MALTKSGFISRQKWILKYLLLLAIVSLHQPLSASDDFVVVASIKPIHSIVSAVMSGAGEPHLVMKGAASPHTFNLRPSDARALHNADVVFQVGEALEENLADIMWTLAERAEIVTLSHAVGLVRRPHREGGAFESDHDHAHHGHSGSHDDEAEHAHDSPDSDVESSTELLYEELDESFDMHIWLDPQNTRVIANVVAHVLKEKDAGNSELYAENLQQFVASIEALEAELANDLAGLAERRFVVFHDAYQYFEDRFGLLAVGSVVVAPGVSAGARRIQELRQKINELEVACVFSEPQFDAKVVDTIIEGTSTRTGILDPLGADLEDGPSLYPALMRNMSESFSTCLTPS